MHRILLGVLRQVIVIVASTLPTLPIFAQDAAPFYAGKTITALVPSGPGGGYDAYARLVARHLGDHLPGNPTIVVKGMPGAGGLLVANYLFNVAAHDGTVIAIMQNNVPFKPMLDARQVKFTTGGFRWLGSVTGVTNLAIVKGTPPLHGAADLFSQELIVGGSGGTTTFIPEMLNRLLHTKFKIVKGYRSTGEILLAMERGEVQGMVGIAHDSLKQSPEAAQGDSTHVLFQMGLIRDRELPDVPLIQEFAGGQEKAVLDCVFSSFQVGRLFAAPLVSENRLAELQNAFRETMADPAFLLDAQRLQLGVNPQSPEVVENIIRSVQQQPEDSVLKLAREILVSAGD